MSPTILEPTVAPSKRDTTREYSSDWETPAGPVDAETRPRTRQPSFIYRGLADPHWRGQSCHLIGAASPDERVVVMACGCRASVPWWTLEPIESR